MLRRIVLLHLLSIARHHSMNADPGALLEGLPEGGGVSVSRFRRLAGEIGLHARVVGLRWAQLRQLGRAYPALALRNDGASEILAGFQPVEGDPDGGRVVLYDTAGGTLRPLARAEFEPDWSGRVVLFKKQAAGEERPFGLGWFVAEALRQRGVFGRVAVIALVLHLLGLVVPLFFQAVVDKVLPRQGVSTLSVLAVGVGVVLLFECTFKFLRAYLLSFASCKIDLRLGTRVFAHLLRLPLSFFERSHAGVLVKHVQQTEQVREFLTGSLLATALDASVLLVFVPLLFLYSARLALVVLGFALVIAAVVALLLGPFARRLQRLYEAEGERQAYLVEAIVGVRTGKTHGLEGLQQEGWEGRSARAALAGFAVEKLSAGAQAVIRTLEKALTVVVVVLGAYAVFDGSLTVGALIAFQMLAGHVSGPLIQVVEMAHRYQRVMLSVRMLGEIMDRRAEETRAGRGLCPELTGGIVLDGVTFAYDPGGAPALRQVGLTINAGEVVGIVGRSGSGKSTLTRLLQGLYGPAAGAIRFGTAGGEVELGRLDLTHLRRSLGVVLQENYLYRGTVRENIALTRPGATAEEVVAAAKLAGAHEFIEGLPHGYDTLLEENGSNLSGGQKQRLAIARALLKQPRVLILDEATSALDVESETVIQRNLARIARGRTTIIIAHRLSTLRDAHRIAVMDHGTVTAVGTHDELLRTSHLYRELWEQQVRNFHGAGADTAEP